MGPVTREAVREFQDLNGLQVDGIVGGKTWSKASKPPQIEQPVARFFVRRLASGRILLVENAAQSIARDASADNVAGLLEQRALSSTFTTTYLGSEDGAFTIRPDMPMPADFDPRA